jgi:hypothetical protein
MYEENVSEVHDPADDYQTGEVPANHDDVDVALQEGKDTADGEGEEEPGESDFVSYDDPEADKEENG